MAVSISITMNFMITSTVHIIYMSNISCDTNYNTYIIILCEDKIFMKYLFNYIEPSHPLVSNHPQLVISATRIGFTSTKAPPLSTASAQAIMDVAYWMSIVARSGIVATAAVRASFQPPDSSSSSFT